MKSFVNESKELYRMDSPIFSNMSVAALRQSMKPYPMFLQKNL